MKILKKLKTGDYVLLALIAAFILYVGNHIEGTLNYNWNWAPIPNYLIRFDEDEQRYVTNFLLEGMFTTLRVCFYASVMALIFGTFLGLARVSKNLAIRMLARTYLEMLRNVPPLVILFIFYFFLSEQLVDALGIERWARGIARSDDAEIWEFFFGDMRKFAALMSGAFVLALFESAFVGEIIRAGIQSVGRGQKEAALSIGLSWFDQMRYIVLPQAFKKVLPPLANEFISLIKVSAIISLISVPELTFRTQELASATRLIFEAWLTTAAMYFVICFGLSLLFRKLEARSANS
jgi:polar amino acid transport system permease protein